MNDTRLPTDIAAKSPTRRKIHAAIGAVLIVSGLVLAWSFGRDQYYEFYAIPKDKGDTLWPRRWQDFVMLGGIWTILVAWLWAGYWLLRGAFRARANR